MTRQESDLSDTGASPIYFPFIIKAERPDLLCFDWAGFDAELERRHRVRCRHVNAPNVPYWRALPDEYEHMVNAMRFNLPPGYPEEISRNKRQCQSEWSIDRPFDPVVQRKCLRPAVEHARVVFALAYDFLRVEGNDPDLAVFLARAALYKFWTHQVDGNEAWAYSGLSLLKNEDRRVEDLVRWQHEHAF